MGGRDCTGDGRGTRRREESRSNWERERKEGEKREE